MNANPTHATGHPKRPEGKIQIIQRKNGMNFKNVKSWGLGALVSISSLAHAQSNDSLAARLDELEQKILVIERLREIEQEDAKAAAAKAPKVSAGEGGFGLSSADGAYSIKLRAFVQLQSLHFLSNATPFTNTQVTPNTTANAPTPHSLSIKRLQPDIGGSLGKQLEYRVHLNLAAGAVDPLDVNVDWKIAPEFAVRAGKFKPPTGLERLISSPRAPFIEGSFVTALQPNRDLGIQFFGAFADGLLEYQAGLFNGARDGQNNTGDNNGDKDIQVRLFSHPFAKSGIEALEGFGIGVAGSQGHQDQYNVAQVNATVVTGTAPVVTTTTITTTPSVSNGISTYGTGRQTVFSYASQDTSSGKVTRLSPQAYWYAGPFGLIAEYTRTTQNIRRATFNEELTHSAWAVTASWFVTGEKNSYKNIKVKKANTFPKLEGIGGVELLARVHALEIDDKAFDSLAANRTVRFADPSRSVTAALGYGAAVKWYLNSNVLIYASYENTGFTGGAGSSATSGTTGVNAVVRDRESEQVVSLSANFAF
jgi:phosphate-selective porin OprO/OprP